MDTKKIELLKNILLVICAVVVFGLLLFVIYQTYEEENKETTKEKETEVKITYKDFKSYDGKFNIKTTENWNNVEEQKSLNKNANLELYNESINAYLLLVSTSKVDYKKDFNSFKSSTFKQKESQYNIKIDKYNDVVISGKSQQYIEFNYTNNNGVNTYIRSYAIETDNYYNQVIIWTLASKKEEVQTEFNDMLSTLSEI